MFSEEQQDFEHHEQNQKQYNYELQHQNIEKDKESSEQMHYEDAITQTGFGLFNYILILISGIILGTVLFETLGISFILPVAECDLQLTNLDKGVISGIGFAGIIASSHLWGFLADTNGRRKIILPTLLLAFTCSVMSSFMNSFYLFVILRFFTGFFISGPSATIYAYLGEFHNMKNRGRVMSFASVIFGLTCALLPIIAWLVINNEWQFFIPIINIIYKPWRLFMIVCALPSLLCSLCLMFIPESPKYVLSQGDQIKAIEILQKINRLNGNREPLKLSSINEENETIKSRQKIAESKEAGGFLLIKLMWSQTSPIFKPPHIKYILIACILQFGIFISSNGMYMWFPDILNRVAEYVNEYPEERITICNILSIRKYNLTDHNPLTNECITKLEIETFEHTFMLEILYAIGFAFIGLVINSVGKIVILVIIFIGCGVCGIITAYVTTPILAIYLYLVILSCGLAIIVVNAATIDMFPTNLRAMAICISLMMGRLGSVVGSYVAGFLIDQNCNEMFVLSGSSLIFCAFLSYFIPKPKSKEVEAQEQNDNFV